MLIRKQLLTVPALALVGLLAACGGDDENTDTGHDVTVSVQNLCDDAALEGASVTFDGNPVGATGTDGRFVVADVADGSYNVIVNKTGFLPQEAVVTVTGAAAAADVELECQSHAVAQAARDFVAKVVAKEASPYTAAQALFDTLNDGDTDNDPVVIDMRAADAYGAGHIEGAVNIGWKAIVSDEALTALGAPGGEEKYVGYCYSGHTAGISTGVMNLLGYTSANMTFGMPTWNLNQGAPFSEDTDANDYLLETEANVSTVDNDPPALAFEGVTDAWEATRAAAAAYLGREGMQPIISAADLFALLTDEDEENDPFVISVRAPDHYDLGHIPGAVNIPLAKLADAESLRQIPTDRPVVVYCYKGTSGGLATAILGTLGYDVRNLKWGIGSWTRDATVRTYETFATFNEFPVVTE